jgi:uncharacterized lipoprotein YddW (UPF0748 family)
MKGLKKLTIDNFWGLAFTIILGTLSCKSISKPESPRHIKGVWLTNVASQVLNTDENIKEAVALLDSLGFNTIYVVTYNEAMTTFPSQVMKRLTGVEIDPTYIGRDPLRTLIQEAHAKNIEVHAWFEFGFSCAYKEKDGGAILKAKPHWAARDINGQIASKNGFLWLNAFDKEVQDFMSSLILEAVKNYDLDGIQGDDRLPALPSLAGYDSLTVRMYQKENFGLKPPAYEKDHNWVKWRSSKLTDYLINLVKEIKSVKPNITISMAPSIYPWSETEYLQDWPTWVNMGLVDYVIPQVYRYQHDRYAYELEKIMYQQVSTQNKAMVSPGILLQVDQYNPSEAMLDSMIQTNRQMGTNGEVYFFYEGIKKYKSYFKNLYKK